MSRRVLIWVQHLLGSGHLRRSLAVAGAAAAAGLTVRLVSGGPPMALTLPKDVLFTQLPPVRSADQGFTRLVDMAGQPADAALMAMRAQQLLAAYRDFAPDLLVTEMFPFGRRPFRHELAPLLADALGRIPILASVREILVSKPDAKWQWMRETCLTQFDGVLVHGDERLLPFGATCPFAAELGARIRHTGFVLTEGVPAPAEQRHGILVSVGGGAVGRLLLEQCLVAAEAFTEQPWHLLAGPNSAAELVDDLRRRAPAHVTVERHREDFPLLLAKAALSVSQAGYNTVAEGLAAQVRMVLIPFAAAGEDEQTIRAQALADKGLAVHLPEAALSPTMLTDAIRAGLRLNPTDTGFSLDGAERTAAILAETRLAA